LAEAGVEPFVGSVGDSYDNALAEMINGFYKAKATPSTRTMALLRGRRVRDVGVGGLVQRSPAAGAHRQHPPAEAEECYYTVLEEPAMAP